MMSTRDRLTASGLLYEGSDFELWLDSLRLLLAGHYERTRIKTSPAGLSITGFRPRDYSDVIAIIWSQVSPNVRSRVPEDSRETPSRLLGALAAAAQPFHFMDLPAEIRYEIYDLVFAWDNYGVGFRVRREWEPEGSGGLSPPLEYTRCPRHESILLSISRQIRAEALPILYRMRTFGFKFNSLIWTESQLEDIMQQVSDAEEHACQSPRMTAAERAHAIHTWASNLMPDSLRFLRKVSVQLPQPHVIGDSLIGEQLH